MKFAGIEIGADWRSGTSGSAETALRIRHDTPGRIGFILAPQTIEISGKKIRKIQIFWRQIQKISNFSIFSEFDNVVEFTGFRAGSSGRTAAIGESGGGRLCRMDGCRPLRAAGQIGPSQTLADGARPFRRRLAPPGGGYSRPAVAPPPGVDQFQHGPAAGWRPVGRIEAIAHHSDLFAGGDFRIFQIFTFSRQFLQFQILKNSQTLADTLRHLFDGLASMTHLQQLTWVVTNEIVNSSAPEGKLPLSLHPPAEGEEEELTTLDGLADALRQRLPTTNVTVLPLSEYATHRYSLSVNPEDS